MEEINVRGSNELFREARGIPEAQEGYRTNGSPNMPGISNSVANSPYYNAPKKYPRTELAPLPTRYDPKDRSVKGWKCPSTSGAP
jgi:hypothetical protein